MLSAVSMWVSHGAAKAVNQSPLLSVWHIGIGDRPCPQGPCAALWNGGGEKAETYIDCMNFFFLSYETKEIANTKKLRVHSES